MDHRVFIYGTLKRGFQNESLRPTSARFECICTTAERFPLVIAGPWYSPYLLDEPGIGARVQGELFRVDSAGLAALDGLEGVNMPSGYSRILIQVATAAGGPLADAFSYVKDRATIASIHDGPLSEYPLDPRYVVPADRTRVFD